MYFSECALYFSKKRKQVEDSESTWDLGKRVPGVGNGEFVRTEGKKELAALRR